MYSLSQQSSNEMVSVWLYDGHFAGANYRKSMELGRFICHGMINLWLWNNGVYGVGVGWFMRALGANCKSNLLIGDLHCCCCVWARACSLIYRPVFCNTPARGAALHWTAGHLLCLSSLSSWKKTLFWNMSGSV